MFSQEKPRQLRVQLGTFLPIDPLYMKSMADYDISLMLYRSWFDYDSGRRAERGLIKSWKFDGRKGCYHFLLEDRKWSDGSSMTAEQFVQNFERIIKSETPFSKSLEAIVDVKQVEINSPKEFSICTKTKKPSETLFNQMGSTILSLVHPADLDSTKTKLATNKLAIGPYKIERISKKEITFKENPFFPKVNLKAPTEIVARAIEPNFSIENFLLKKTWANYYQTNSLLPVETASKILSSKFPLWTRGIDRVALLRPAGDETEIARNRKLLTYLGYELNSVTAVQNPLQVHRARSLQPFGYPLFKEIDYPKIKRPNGSEKIRILSYSVPALRLYQTWLVPLAAKAGIQIEWKIVGVDEFLSMDWDKSKVDFVLYAFGVADPEPTTWLGLVFGKKFIAYSSEEHDEFEALIKMSDHEKQTAAYRELIYKIGLRGGYLPLLHGATISIGRPGMNFDLVHKLDETIDYSKIQFTK